MPNDNDNDPLTPAEFEKLLHALDITCQNVQRLLNQGVLATESLDDERIAIGRRKIDGYKDKIRVEQARIKRIQNILRRRKASRNRSQ